MQRFEEHMCNISVISGTSIAPMGSWADLWQCMESKLCRYVVCVRHLDALWRRLGRCLGAYLVATIRESGIWGLLGHTSCGLTISRIMGHPKLLFKLC